VVRSVAEMERIERIAEAASMLSRDVLRRMALLANDTSGCVLEIGAYRGGGTISLAASAPPGRVITIEAGGSHQHPTHASDDILRDLRTNLSEARLSNHCTVIEGWSYSHAVRKKVAAALKRTDMRGLPISVLCLDADGHISRVICNYGHLLDPCCALVIDDYSAPGAPGKEDMIRPLVDRLMQDQIVRESGVFPYGTWFGRLNGPEALRKLPKYGCPFVTELGYCCVQNITSPEPGNSNEEPTRSRLRLFEDGKPLGPPHSLSADVRERGRGCYAHWERGTAVDKDGMHITDLYFSASDNSDPTKNGRCYTARTGDAELNLSDL
jgi:predicted O-methyltransferase YrrM